MECINQYLAIFLSTVIVKKKSPNENESNHSVGSGLFRFFVHFHLFFLDFRLEITEKGLNGKKG